MSHYKLALLGFGNVGQALARLLNRKQDEIKLQYNISYGVTGIATRHHGIAINHDGIDLEKALDCIAEDSPLDILFDRPPPRDTSDFIQLCNADVLFENTPVNYENGQPAIEYIQIALENGMHVITANKGPVVHAYSSLSQLAQSQGKKFYFESAVMDGAPIFSLFRCGLPAAHLRSFRGILNSTTNLILSRMESGEDFNNAVAYAQSIGIAETDPSGDVDGWDAAIKVAALVNVLMNKPIKPEEVDRRGIGDISLEDIAQARSMGKRWKLICSARQKGESIEARVAPEMIPADSQFYFVDGTTSIIEFESDVLGKLSIIEKDPGPHTTAYGLLADLINAVR